MIYLEHLLPIHLHPVPTENIADVLGKTAFFVDNTTRYFW